MTLKTAVQQSTFGLAGSLFWSPIIIASYFENFCEVLFVCQYFTKRFEICTVFKEQTRGYNTLLIVSGHSQTKINLSFSVMVSLILRYGSFLKFVSSRYLFNNKTWSQRSVWYFICGVTTQFKCHTLFPPALIFMTVNNRGLYERKLNNKVQISALSIIAQEVIKYQTMPLKSFFLSISVLSFQISPIFSKIVRFLEHFCTCLVCTDKTVSLWKWRMQILLVCTSCKTTYNDQNHSHECHNLGAGSFCGVGVCWHSGGGGVQEIESPDLRSPEVGISALKLRWKWECSVLLIRR